MKMGYSYIPTSSENMTAAESTGTSSEIQEQYEKTLSFRKRTCAKKKNFAGGVFLFSPSKRKNKGDKG